METKEKIIEVAIKLFSNYGYHKTTMSMIAEKADVAKGTLYWYYSSKQELFKGILNYSYEKYFSFLTSIRDEENLTSQEKLKAIIDFRVEFFRKNEAMARVIMSNKEGLDQDFKEELIRLRRKHEKLLTEVFKQGINSGEFVLKDPRLMALIFIASINYLAISDYSLLLEENKEKTIDFLKEIFLLGILKKS